MKKVSILRAQDFSKCFNLLDNNNGDKEYFSKIGWKLNQFEQQILKDNNFSIGIFRENILIGFVLGDLINLKKEIEYEILILYVNPTHRNLGFASKLIKNISLLLKEKNLKKIYLEVASNNISAIKLYNRNKFIKVGVRKKYYSISKKIDAYIFEKKINE